MLHKRHGSSGRAFQRSSGRTPPSPDLPPGGRFFLGKIDFFPEKSRFSRKDRRLLRRAEVFQEAAPPSGKRDDLLGKITTVCEALRSSRKDWYLLGRADIFPPLLAFRRGRHDHGSRSRLPPPAAGTHDGVYRPAPDGEDPASAAESRGEISDPTVK